MNRFDMLSELASEQINQLIDMAVEGDHEAIHSWLHPLLLADLQLDFATLSDKDFAEYYSAQMGVDLPQEPT